MHQMIFDEDQSATFWKSLRPWKRPTAAQIRNVVMNEFFIIPQARTAHDADNLIAKMTEAFSIAVLGGRLFDFGHVPDAVIQSESGRAADLFFSGHIGHPFRDPYAFFHTWDSGSVSEASAAAGDEDAGSLYVVDPFDINHLTDGLIGEGAFLVCEAQAVRASGRDALIIGDVATVRVARNANDKVSYQIVVVQNSMNRGKNLPESLSAINLMDPIMACLLLLATDGIAVDTVEPPAKINQTRAKNGRPAIPPHYEVKTNGYVTALNARTRRNGPGLGHHGSPVPHLRRGHIRHLHERHGGGTTWVRDAVINLKDPDGPVTRAFYQRGGRMG